MMTSPLSPKSSCAVILAGGFGTRIRSVCPNLPKPMIPVAGEPFIAWVLRYLAGQGIPNFVISLGYRAEVAEDYFRTRPTGGGSLQTVRENKPLGTGGALLMAEPLTETSDPVVLANGDSLVLADLSGAWRLLREESVDGVVIGIEVDDASRYGRLETAADGRLRRFDEKQPGPAVINAGIYLFRRRLLHRFPQATPLSMERDVFPALLSGGAKLIVHRCRAPFLDIGTPESLGQADAFIRQHFRQVAA
ncbi:MAG TPA: nucleotidyltransferase family protein [Pirellulales bacterium]|nr:nucleotidyltransferase family protein [Pirellulales bacterium]